MDSAIFRKVALERLSSPERLDQPRSVATPKEWLALLGIFLLLAASVAWGFEGSLATKVNARGVIIRPGGIVNVVAPAAGLVVELNVKTGDTVAVNQVIARIAQPGQMEKIRVTEEALADSRRERERALRIRTDSARLQLEALARQRANAEREISSLDEQMRIADEQIPVDEQLVERGLITRQQSLASREKKATLESQRGALEAQIKQFDAQQFSIENQPGETDIDMQTRVTDLERNLASMRKDLATTSNVVSPYAGQVLERKVYRGGAVSEGVPVVSIQPTAGSLEVLVYLSSVEAKDVRPGMTAQITPGAVRREEFGFMLGKVTFVAAYPATPAAMMNTLGNESLMQSLAAAGPVTELHIDPQPAATPSGFLWSSRQGPPLPISSGTICSAQIVTNHEKPISRLLPIMKDTLAIN